MQYNGIELVEMVPENWNGKSREMLVWDNNSPSPYKRIVVGYVPGNLTGWIPADYSCCWQHCAEIPIVAEEDVMKLLNDNEKEILELKAENKVLKTKVDELKNSCSYQVYSDMWNEKTKFESKIANLKAENDELKARIKSLRAERHEMASVVSNAVWKELMDRATQKSLIDKLQLPTGFGFNDISDIVLNKIIEYKPEKKLRRMTYKELDEWLEQGKGVVRIADVVKNTITYDCEDRNHEVSDYYKICGYDEDTWHEPMIEE